MSPSSIFSSETLRGPFRLPKAATLAVGLLALLECGVVRQEWFWDADPYAPPARVTTVGRELDAAVRPGVVILGSSRPRSTLDPRWLGPALGLAPERIQNAAFGGGTPFDALTLYRRHRGVMRQAEYLIVGFDDWYGNASLTANVRDRRYATLRERWSDYPTCYRASLLTGYLWRTVDSREVWLEWLSRLANPTGPVGSRAEPGGWQPPEPSAGPAPIEESLANNYAAWAPDTGRLRQLQTLLDLARSDGLAPVVVIFPCQDAYLDAAEEQYPSARAHFRNLVAQIRSAAVIDTERPAIGGLVAEEFYDYGHLTASGSRRYGAVLGRMVRERVPGGGNGAR